MSQSVVEGVKTVLLVDDHQLIRELIRNAIKAHCENVLIVAEAVNGKEAVEKTAIFQPDVIIIDIAMPIMNGIEAIKIIRKTNSTVKIVSLSTNDCFKEIALAAGADRFFLKDDSIQHLISEFCA